MVINPWLYKSYTNGIQFDEERGILINQEYFEDWIKYDNLKRYFYRDINGDEYLVEINQNCMQKRTNKFL